MRRTFHGGVAALAAASLPAATFGADMTAVGDGEGEVSIVAWAGYIERGDTDKNFDWVTKFEADTGCKVSVKTAATSDEMVALMNEGGFDLVTASGDASLRLIAGKTVQPINTDLIPSWSNVDERLQNAPWHTVDGVHYGVPYAWGSNVLMYNTEVFKEAPKSWNVVFEPMDLPDGKPNAGRVQAFDGPIYIADAALYLMNHKPELGIKDPYELNEDQYKAALELLRAQRKIVSKYWHDAFVQIDDFTNEGFVASSSWPFQVNILQSQTQADRFDRAGGRRDGWADTTMMHAEAAHPNCAYKWLEHSIEREGAGRSRRLVRHRPGQSRRLQGQRAADRRGLRHQRPRQLRQDPFLADAGGEVRDARRGLRAVLSLGVGLHRHPRRPLNDGWRDADDPSP